MTIDVIRLVLGVARLGEKDLRGWSKGHAIDRIGQYVLSDMFRRTWKSAALELDVAAASQMHRELLGRSTALHLFSDLLPFRCWAIGWLAGQKTAREPGSMLGTLQRWTEDDSTETLRFWCRAVESPPAQPFGDGPLLGRLTTAELDDPATLQQVARLLHSQHYRQLHDLKLGRYDAEELV
jgi:hypothetical protein